MDGWLDRLRGALERDGRSARAVSIAAGFGPNYLSELLNSQKEPGIDKVMRLCKELNVAPGYIVTGVDLSAQGEEYAANFASLPPDQQAILLQLSRQLKTAKL